VQKVTNDPRLKTPNMEQADPRTAENDSLPTIAGKRWRVTIQTDLFLRIGPITRMQLEILEPAQNA